MTLPIGKFLGHGWRRRGLFCEAFGLLCWARLLIRLVPFRGLAPRLGKAQAESSSELTVNAQRTALDVAWAIGAATRHAPLRFVCLPQALAAKWMLRRRGIANTLYLGIAAGRETESAMTAHAWLRSGDKIITGAREMGGHVVVLSLADGP
ncbi:MAG TPA: lasso peptide biosynthesis B2 protein [Opitutaceae bacterium]|nr:lasso peptide biosynthesis B2 protein [Opitutaceae bacterium]